MKTHRVPAKRATKALARRKTDASFTTTKGGTGKRKEGADKMTPITGLISNSFVPAFNRMSYNACLRYGQAVINLTAATSLANAYVFSVNGLFDPSVTGGSLQPAGFAQLMLSYDHYVVTKARASVIFTNNGTSSAIVSLRVNDDATVTTDPSNLLELPQEQIVFLDPAAGYGSSKTLSIDCDVAAYNGIGKSILSDPVFRGDVVSNPTEQSYFHCGVFAVKGGTADVYLTVVIDYYATFQEPRVLSPSLTKTLTSLVKRDALLHKEEESKRAGFQRDLLTMDFK